MAQGILRKNTLMELYEKDFYLWLMENLKLLKEKSYDKVDWEHLLEEIEGMGKSELRSVISYVAVILEHLYKWENFRVDETMGHSWIRSIYNAREELALLFEYSPSLKKKAEEDLEKSWKIAVGRIVRWFKDPDNKELAKKFFRRLPEEKDFPARSPYTFEQVLGHEPWLSEQ
ncbi:DUF29 domain-containing protein [Thermocrinis sp.]